MDTTDAQLKEDRPSYQPQTSQRNLDAQYTRYTKGELVGQGACKRVFRGFDEELGIEVAWNEVPVHELASSSEKERDRVFGEIALLKQLKHKNVLALHDWWYDKKNSTLVFITELFMDGSLRSYRRKHKNVDVTVLKRWAWQILQGLVYLHGHNPPIIHRDLKSDNIFVNGTSGILKIGDLGFATFRAGFSAAMSVIGTPEFMAPELYEERYNEKVDVYSFGLCLLELATLEYPYAECRNPAQIFKKVSSGVPPQGLAKIQDDELREFVQLCIQPNAAQRPEARQLLKHPFFDCIREAPRKPYPAGLLQGVGSSGNLGMHHMAPGQHHIVLDSSSQHDSPNTLHSPANMASPGTSMAGAKPADGYVSLEGQLHHGTDGGAGPGPTRLASTNGAARPVPASAVVQQPAHLGPSSIAAAAGGGVGGIAAAAGGPVAVPTPFGMDAVQQSVSLNGDLHEDTMYGGSPPHDGHQSMSPQSSPGMPAASPTRSGLAGQHSKEFAEELEEAGGEEDEAGGLAIGGADLHNRVRLACRNYQDNMLAFSMSFVNDRGLRKKVGFQYDVQADTAKDIADEMVENLSLDPKEAQFIADLIQGEIQRHERTSALTAALQKASVAGAGAGDAGASAAPPPQQQQQQQAQAQPHGAAPGMGELPEGEEQQQQEEEEPEEEDEEEDPSCFF